MKTAIAISLLACLTLTGCDLVKIDKPFGEQVDSKRLAIAVGRWSDEEHKIFELRVSKTGELVGGNLVWDEESQRYKSNSGLIDVRTASGVEYLFATNKDSTIFVRVEIINDDQIRLYIPDPKAFREAVLADTLSGKVVETKSDRIDVRLIADDKLERFLERPNWRGQYLPDTTVTYTRLSAPK